MNKLLTIILLAVCCYPAFRVRAQQHSATISGAVTDFEANPLEGVEVSFQNPLFDDIYLTHTDSDFNYRIEVAKGEYYNTGALNMEEYCITGSTLPQEELRLEFWAWDFITDRDDLRYELSQAGDIRTVTTVRHNKDRNERFGKTGTREKEFIFSNIINM